MTPELSSFPTDEVQLGGVWLAMWDFWQYVVSLSKRHADGRGGMSTR